MHDWIEDAVLSVIFLYALILNLKFWSNLQTQHNSILVLILQIFLIKNGGIYEECFLDKVLYTFLHLKNIFSKETSKSFEARWFFSEFQFSHSLVSDCLWPHGLQQARPTCPSPTPRAYSNSCPLSQWCHLSTSSAVVPFFSCLQSFPASRLFPKVSSLHQVAKVLEFQLQHQSFQWLFRTGFF